MMTCSGKEISLVLELVTLALTTLTSSMSIWGTSGSGRFPAPNLIVILEAMKFKEVLEVSKLASLGCISLEPCSFEVSFSELLCVEIMG